MQSRAVSGFVHLLALENLESSVILNHFPGQNSPRRRLLVLESSGNL